MVDRDDPRLTQIQYFTTSTGRQIPMHYGRRGEPVSLLEWARMYEDTEARTLGRDVVGDFSIITMWFGLDEDPLDDDEDHDPLIFGTAIFLNNVDAKSMVRETRWATEEGALEGHAQAVADVAEWSGATPPA